ncbi:MAG: hypothetical protein ACRDQD_20415, partial [Nocardioidaceae bacterium]
TEVGLDADIGALKVLEKDGTTTRVSIDRPGKRYAAGTELFLSDHVAGAASPAACPTVEVWGLSGQNDEVRSARSGLLPSKCRRR